MSSIIHVHGFPESFNLPTERVARLVEQARLNGKLLRIDRPGEKPTFVDPWAVEVIRPEQAQPSMPRNQGRMLKAVEPDQPEPSPDLGGVCAQHGPYELACVECPAESHGGSV